MISPYLLFQYLQDALTDLTAECEDMDVEGVEPSCKAHKGMTRAARYVLNQLNEKGILETAYSTHPVSLRNWRSLQHSG